MGKKMAIRLLFLTAFFFLHSFVFSFPRIHPRFPPPNNNNVGIQPEFVASGGSAKTESQLYETNYYTQILDHFTFTPQSYQTFQQRYLISHKYWGGAKENAPIFVYTGNEGDIEWFTQNTGFMFEQAPHFKALLVFIEHRFYGKSIPFGGDKEVAYSNSSTLGYLTSTQALADYATLIIDLKNNLTANDCPVVVFGGSYGGMLAAWFRLKYPHVAIGALASSAPILYFDNITSQYSFYDTVGKDFRSESQNCYKVIKGSWQQIEDTAKQTGGQELLRKSFRICKKEINVVNLEGWLSDAFLYTAMTDYPTPTNFLQPLPADPVKQMCKAIDNAKAGSNVFEKLYGAANVYYNHTGKVPCFDISDDSDPHGLAEWQWQACTEMIMPMEGNSARSIFPPDHYNSTLRAQSCYDAYGVHIRPNWITTEFGGHNIHRVLKRFGSNIIFFNGLRDPWSGGGVLKDISDSIVAIVAKKGAHHVDLRFSTSEDPKWLKDVRRKEVKIIKHWLSQYYTSLTHSH